MSKAQHTPGPWSIRDEIFSNERHVRIYGSDVTNVANLNTYPSLPVEANARLIAAAPELLAALGWLADSGEVESPEALSVIRDAIAKAKGQ